MHLVLRFARPHRPEKVHAQSVLQFAEVADTHRFQAEHNLLCSPFNLPTLLCFWLPAGRRKKRPPAFFSAVATAYLDGVCTRSPPLLVFSFHLPSNPPPLLCLLDPCPSPLTPSPQASPLLPRASPPCPPAVTRSRTCSTSSHSSQS